MSESSNLAESCLVITPDVYQETLSKQAAADIKRIVLPESEDDRILKAAAIARDKGIAQVILLGEKDVVEKRANELGLDLRDIIIQPIDDERYLDSYAAKIHELRASKGVTLEDARELLKDVSYYGTVMILMGDADGMVSGASHTTAHTIRPALQLIKTKPGVSTVSGAFLMLMKDHVDVYADCAVCVDPDSEQLAGIAISTAETAVQFCIDPLVAMLSYSTGVSGVGPSVDKVRRATEIVREKAPELLIDGPLQYDAALDPVTASKKAPDSPVAGKANVFVFPDLNSGNICYKAVQRSSGAIAVGPILQGLNKPVNDLSRGALVDDIVNTITLTAIQAQG